MVVILVINNPMSMGLILIVQTITVVIFINKILTIEEQLVNHSGFLWYSELTASFKWNLTI